jgi:two-component system NtrC family sensor kinase
MELALMTVLVMVAVLASVTWLSLNWQRSSSLKEVERGLVLTGEALQNSLRQRMMQNRREEILADIEEITQHTRIERIRLIEHQGRITMSTHNPDVGTRLQRSSEGCRLCHGTVDGSGTAVPHGVTPRTVVEDKRMRAFVPVLAEPRCLNQSCHAQEERSQVLGLIDITMSLQEVERDLVRSEASLVGLSLAAVVAGGTLLWFAFARRLHGPMRDLLRGIRRIAAGDLNHRIPQDSSDEFGELARSLNTMSQQLAAAQQSLIQTERLVSMGKLAAGVAHEINNPLTGILSYAEDLLSEADPADPRREEYGVIVHEALRCRQIVRSLLDFARQDAPALILVHPREILERALNVVSRQAAFRNIKFERHVEPGLPAIPADPVQIEQVLLNLIVNAQEAMPQGGIIVVGARHAREGSGVEFWVKDEGSGIPPEVQTRIFEPFFSTKGGKTDGLGLAVTLGIVQRHGGHIDFQTEPGLGTLFRVTLPTSRASEQQGEGR